MPITLTVLAILVALAIGFVWGRRGPRAEHERGTATAARDATPAAPVPAEALHAPASPEPVLTSAAVHGAELARVLRSFEAEAAACRRSATSTAAALGHLAALAEERRALFTQLADSRAEAARYRSLVIDIENDAPPPILGGRGTPDDLKLIVGIGPVLERMLHQLGITSYRQIARWTERDIDVFDARLAEFPGRIRRDSWVTQARALHQSLHRDAL